MSSRAEPPRRQRGGSQDYPSSSADAELRSDAAVRKLEPRRLEPRRLEPRSLEPRSLEPRALEPRSLEPRSVEPWELEPRSLEPRALEPRNGLIRVGDELLPGGAVSLTRARSSIGTVVSADEGLTTPKIAAAAVKMLIRAMRFMAALLA